MTGQGTRNTSYTYNIAEPTQGKMHLVIEQHPYGTRYLIKQSRQKQ